MPTRLYFSDAQAAAVSPAFAAGWEETDGAVWRKLLQAKEAGEALNLGTRLGWTAANDQADRGYVSDSMDAGNVFTTAVTAKMQLATREFALADNSTSRIQITIVSQDGTTHRVSLFTIVSNRGPATEYISNASLRNKAFIDGDALDSTGLPYTTVAGDRLFVQIGHSDAAGSTPEAQARYGAPSGTADHGENETETTSLVPWVEFSNTITFQAATDQLTVIGYPFLFFRV